MKQLVWMLLLLLSVSICAAATEVATIQSDSSTSSLLVYVLAIGIIIFISVIFFLMKFRHQYDHRVFKARHAALSEYVKTSLGRGRTKEQVLERCKEAGWKEEHVKHELDKHNP